MMVGRPDDVKGALTMTTHTLAPGTTVRNAMTGRLGTIRRWDPEFDSYVVRWENYDFNIHCRTARLTLVNGSSGT
jgi:hypothetical protein